MRDIVAALVAVGILALGGPATLAAAAARPNVVVIETDDQTVADMAVMPNTRALIGGRGVTFTQSIVSLSECCPSRATFLTGRYAHNHRVLSTQPPFGGYPAFEDDESLAVWLQRAGYETALVGKYLNGYGRDDAGHVPAGWSDWRGLLGPSTYQYYGFGANENGTFTLNPREYKTDFLTSQAVDAIDRHSAGPRPLFLWLTYVAPHIGSPVNPFDPISRRAPVPSGLHLYQYVGVPMPTTAAFDEADVSDKPPDVRRLPRLGRRAKAEVMAEWQRRQESLLSVDHGVARVVDALDRAGVLDDTLLVFTSDNGYLLGEHRVRDGKVLPYEPSIRVPLLMRGPGVPAGVTRSQLVFNGDLAPTIAEAAGARAPWEFDGTSLWPLLRDPGAGADRAVLLEAPPISRADGRPQFAGVRTPRHVYVEHAGGARELYDLRTDPEELDNLAGTHVVRGLQARLARTLRVLRRCEGDGCR